MKKFRKIDIDWVVGQYFLRRVNGKGVWRYWEWGGLHADRGKDYIWRLGLVLCVEIIIAIGSQRRDGPV